MLKNLLLAVVVVIALLLLYAATRPDTFRFERTVRIEAPPERVFALINDLQRFNEWNPYARKDPTMKGRYGATTIGPGASYSWEGDKIGSGRMEITETAAPSRVTMDLDFIKPFEAHNVADFTLVPDGSATLATWAMRGPSPYISRLVQIFFSMDRMLGADFDDGLKTLKSMAESR